MYIKDLQNILGEFTDGKKGNNIRDAKIYVSLNPSQVAEIKKMEVQSDNIVGSREPLRVVLFPFLPSVNSPRIFCKSLIYITFLTYAYDSF